MNLAKTYTPNDYEPTIYALWEKSGVFEPTGQGEPYAIVMPPPNANGDLHLGHALGYGIEDMLVRFHRMKGKDAVLIPGTDHAGFETWVVYERELEKQGKSRFDFTREQLYAQVWDFVDRNRGNMGLQLRAIGIGAAWNHSVFTLDKKVIDTVYDTFKKMWDDDLVYRSERIVNYCIKHQTSFSDIEVSYKNEKSKLWNIAYPMLDRVGEIIVATTRPETMLGDVAVAVHPEDERYKDLVGTKVLLPLTNREIPIIADEHVDREYGTGVVKVTPAHDPNDFEIGERHQLEVRQVIGLDGLMVNVPPQFNGLTISEARKRVLAALQLEELLRGEKEIEHSVGHCYKCGTIIEPMVKDQWFVRVASLAARAIESIENGEIRFVPENKGRVLANYLRGLKDWNISRQIPWGIPIPAFSNPADPSDWIFDTRIDEQQIDVNGTTYIRDNDTFDTWFSSGQWPYVVTDYLDSGELARFYPTAVMETGYDILYQWVGRMIMLGLYCTDKVPFKNVYLHGLVNDEHNQKMSKSKGNVINPMEMIAEFGSDALRLGIISSRSAAQSQAFSKGKVVAGRNFCNKLWNIARYTQGVTADARLSKHATPHSIADHWIIRELNKAGQQIERQLEQYRFAEAAETIYHVIWDDVADWYIEASKIEPNPPLLAWVLETCLRLAHPFAPFVTETIWQTLPWCDGLLAASEWPKEAEHNELSAGQFGRLKKLVTETRWVTSELPGNDKYTMLYMDDSLVADNSALIKHLARLEKVEHADQARGLRLAAAGRDAWLDITEELLYEHQQNLELRLANTRAEVATLEKRLANEGYLAKAPVELVEESREQLQAKQQVIERLQRELQVISDN